MLSLWPEVVGAVLALLLILGMVYAVALRPIGVRRRRLTAIKHGLRKKKYKLYPEMEFDQDHKKMTLAYGNLVYTFDFDECDLGWFFYDNPPATKERVIIPAPVFNNDVALFYSLIDGHYIAMGFDGEVSHEELAVETTKKYFRWQWPLRRSDHLEGSSA